MADKMLYPGSILALRADAADRLMASGNGDAALLYLHLLRVGGPFRPQGAVHALKWDPGRAEEAFQALVKLGQADAAQRETTPPAPAAEEPPEYTAADLTREMEDQSPPFPALVGEVQRRLGKILSTSDLKMLYTLYDFLALPAEVIMLLVSWCVEEMERKYGAGRKPRMAQIRKEGFVWHRLGLDTAEAAEAHLRRQSALRTRTARLLPLLDIQGRPPVEAEQKYLISWVEMGFEDGAIRLAYERTVLKKQSLNWSYMNSILKSWHQKGLHTVDAVLQKDSSRPRTAAPAPAAPAPAARGNGGPVQDDLERMLQYMDRQSGGEGGR